MSVLAFLLIAFTASGCTRHFEEDYLDKFGPYINYSLGEFEIIANGESRSSEWASIPIAVTYKSWTLQYERQNGEVSTFTFNNYSGNDIFDFGRDVIRHAAAIGAHDIRQGIARDYFLPEELDIYWGIPFELGNLLNWQFRLNGLNGVSFVLQPPSDDYFRETGFAYVLNPQNGLQFHSITPQELVADWGFALCVSVVSQDYERYEDVIERLKAISRALADNLELEQCKVRFILLCRDGHHTCDISFEGNYYGLSDWFEIMSFAELGFNSHCCG